MLDYASYRHVGRVFRPIRIIVEVCSTRQLDGRFREIVIQKRTLFENDASVLDCNFSGHYSYSKKNWWNDFGTAVELLQDRRSLGN